MKPANILSIDTLSEEWFDKDGVMLHACFQLLENFIKEETNFLGNGNEDFVDWEYDEKHRQAKQEMLFLYTWWQEYNHARLKNAADWEDEQIENEMPKRLIDIRWAMWT